MSRAKSHNKLRLQPDTGDNNGCNSSAPDAQLREIQLHGEAMNIKEMRTLQGSRTRLAKPSACVPAANGTDKPPC
jgi:hypothetical protein